ncbi:MAG: hypothetical protein KAR42_11540 [candidate division Zixibacteria bacterium]|nr:hypothetical protein [candidate division Zixibacteria bacterium]
MRKTIITFVLLLLFVTPVLSANTFDKHNPAPKKDIFFFGTSVGTSGKFSFGYDISYVHKKSIFTFGAVINEEPGSGFSTNSDSEADIHLLYGRCGRTKLTVFSISGGLGLVKSEEKIWISRESNFYTTKRHFGPTVSFPFQAQIVIRPVPMFGIGGKIYGNLNSKNSFIGIQFMFIVGKLWD